MRWIELYAEEFGCLIHRHFVFGDGLTVIEGENESGKSTMQALIRFLLYGFPRRTGEDAEERNRRLSRTTHRAAGSVVFALDGKRYKIYRDYVLHTMGGRELPAERVQVTDEQGAVLDLGGKTPGEYFLSLPVELYHASVCVREADLARVADARVEQTVADALFVGQGTAPLARAEKILDNARRELWHNRGNGGKIFELKQKILDLDEALGGALAAAEKRRALKDEMAELGEQISKMTATDHHLEEMETAAHLSAELARYDAWHAARAELETLSQAAKSTGAVRQYVSAQGGAAGIRKRAARLAKGRRIFAPVCVFFALLTLLSVAVSVWLDGPPWLAAMPLACTVIFAFAWGRARKNERAFCAHLGVEGPVMIRTALARLDDGLEQRQEAARGAVAALERGLTPERECALRAKLSTLPTPTADLPTLAQHRAGVGAKVGELSRRLAAAQLEEAALAARAEEPTQLRAQRAELAQALGAAQNRLRAIQMASEALGQASESLRSDVMPRLGARASEIFESLTGGARSRLIIGEGFSLSVLTPEGAVPLSHFSAGCRDAAYLALRLALADLLTEEPLPLALDEVTSHLDDARAKNLLTLLAGLGARGRQALLFTCHTRDARLLEGENITHIRL